MNVDLGRYTVFSKLKTVKINATVLTYNDEKLSPNLKLLMIPIKYKDMKFNCDNKDLIIGYYTKTD